MENGIKINAYILCGGKSRRMGSEKGLMVYENRTFIECCLHAIKPIAQGIALVTQNEEYRKYGYPLLADIYKDRGPVGAIFTALKSSSTEWNLILSCDTPKISTSILKKYLLKRRTPDILIDFLSDGENDYPLIGMYHKKTLDAFHDAIGKGDLKLMNLIRKLGHRKIIVNGEAGHCLHNINTKQELELLIQGKHKDPRQDRPKRS